MKFFLYLFAIFIAFILMAGIKVKFNPFEIKFTSIYFAIGIVLVMIGIGFIRVDSYRKGVKNVCEHISESLKSKENGTDHN